MTGKSAGSCLCGEVHIRAGSISKAVGVCHCGMCRKWTGGPMMAVECGTDVEFENLESITTFSSSAWGERGFCGKCGSSLFYRIKETGEYFLPAGIFEDQGDFCLNQQIFIDKKPGFYEFANDTEDMTSDEFFAKYTS
jgi:hypothetical protein